MSTPTVRLRHWTRLEYEKMVDAGIFGPEDRIELLDGEIVEMSPQGNPHVVAVALANEALIHSLPAGCHIRPQGPFALDELSQPEPDFAVVRGAPRDYLGGHPSEVLLVVEISHSSLAYDRGRKLRAYARNGVPEYWILNLVDRRLEVYGNPSGERYGDVAVLTATDRVTPLYAPDAAIPVADLLP